MRTPTALLPLVLLGTLAMAPNPGLAAPGAPAANQPATNLPDGYKVLEDYVEAIGGEKAYRKYKSEELTGTIEIPALGAIGTIVLRRQASTKTMVTIELEGLGSIIQGTNGEVAWRSQLGMPTETLEGDEADRLINEANYYATVEPRKTYTEAKTVGKVTFDGVECYQLELVTRWGDHQVGLFEVETGLHRKISTRTAPGSDTFTTETTYNDYRRVKGLKRPFSLEISAMGMKQVITFDSIEMGAKFDKDTFDPPKN